LNKVSARVRYRTQTNIEGKKYSKRERYESEVMKARKATAAGVRARVKDRNAVVFTEKPEETE